MIYKVKPVCNISSLLILFDKVGLKKGSLKADVDLLQFLRGMLQSLGLLFSSEKTRISKHLQLSGQRYTCSTHSPVILRP